MLTSYNVPFYCDVIFRRHTFNSFSLLQLHEVSNINLLGVLNVLLYFLTTKSSIHFLESTKVIAIERAIKNHKRSCISLCLILVHLFVTLQDKNRQDICFNFTISTNQHEGVYLWHKDIEIQTILTLVIDIKFWHVRLDVDCVDFALPAGRWESCRVQYTIPRIRFDRSLKKINKYRYIL